MVFEFIQFIIVRLRALEDNNIRLPIRKLIYWTKISLSYCYNIKTLIEKSLG
jgi:hypothetical protein